MSLRAIQCRTIIGWKLILIPVLAKVSLYITNVLQSGRLSPSPAGRGNEVTGPGALSYISTQAAPASGRLPRGKRLVIVSMECTDNRRIIHPFRMPKEIAKHVSYVPIM